jgi:dynein light chain 4
MADIKKQMQAPMVHSSDILGDMKGEVVDIIVGGVDKYSTNMEMAAKQIKEALDKQFGTTWQVIIGKGFSFDITSLDNTYMHCFYQGDLAILAYKS